MFAKRKTQREQILKHTYYLKGTKQPQDKGRILSLRPKDSYNLEVTGRSDDMYENLGLEAS